MTSFSMGSLLDRSKFVHHLTVRSNEELTLKKQMMQLEMAMKRILIFFSPPDSKARRIYKLNVSFSILSHILVEKAVWPARSGTVKLYFILNSAPLLHCSELDKNAERKLKISQNLALEVSRLPWFRTTTIFYENGSGKQSIDEHLLGMSRSLCVEMEDTSDGLLNSLQNISSNFQEVKYLTVDSLIQHQQANLDFRTLCVLLDDRNLPFSIYYACRVLFGDSYALLDALNSSCEQLNNFLDTIQEVTNEDDNGGQSLASLEKCLYHLKTQCKDMATVTVNVYDEFTKLLGNLNLLEEGNFGFSKGTTDYVLIRRATLTPATLVLQPPIPLLKSRFSTLANTDYAIRLTILEDNNRKLNGGGGKNKRDTDFVQGVIKSHLLEGVQVGDRLYEFLGSSSSQMREHGVILYARDEQGHVAQHIRDMAGDLSNFKRNVAKYVARFGLMFSQAMAIIPEIPETQAKVCIIEDVLGGVKPNFGDMVNRKGEHHILSDGVGIIERSVVEQSILPYLRLTSGNCSGYIPSAFQIRFGGCKGMLVVFDTSVPAIVFRRSMKKYDSADSSLGILKHSLPRPVTLNRPLVNILDQMGVERMVLYRLLEEATSSVAKAALYDQAALELVRIYSTAYLPYDRLLTAGISLLGEPFLRSIVDYLINYRLNELKSKARIRVPFSCGRTAFGVFDESGTLEYGEVFFQYTKMEMDSSGQLSSETVILEGEVMVTKFPCLQPGDVRKLRAVNVKKLRHLKDCIVFPSKGTRPHPDEMGGSDLDGDEFAIFTKESGLLFPGENATPMDFPYGLSKENQTDISMADIVEFYTNFLLLNNIGQVAYTHLAISDAHPKGLHSEECHELALLYSISLDFQKTGVIREFPQKFFSFNLRPDFMERAGGGVGHDKVYLSKRILGQFYRHCSLIERIVSLGKFESVAPFASKSGTSYGKNVQLILPGWQKYACEAEQALLKYQLKAVEVMDQLTIAGEAVLFSDVYEDKSDASRVLVRGMFEHFQALFTEQVEKLKLSEPKERLLLASAWYAIVYEQQKNCSKQLYNGQPLLGLPWLIPEEICILAQYSYEHGSRDLGEEVILNSDVVCFSVKKLNNTEVSHYYWCPVKAITAVRERFPNHLSLAYDFLENLQKKVVLRMLVNYVSMLKGRVYEDHSSTVITVRHATGPEMLEDSHMLRQILQKKIQEIVTACGRVISKDGFELLPTITTILNCFWSYLFDICNGINSTLYLKEQTKLEELFLFKYAIYGMTFFNKFNFKLDRKFYTEYSTDFEKSWEVDLQLYLNGGSQVGGDDGFCHNTEYEEAFKEVFNTHLIESIKNNSFKKETVSYILPPMEVDLFNDEVFKNSLITKLRHLSGASMVSLTHCSDSNSWRKMAAESGQSFGVNTVAYELKATGLVQSTQIIRLLIGHPDFFSQTWQSYFDCKVY